MATNTKLGTKTNMKTTKETNPFGVIHFNLHSKLHKAGKYAQAQFNLYISCRSNVPAWEFNESDIRVMTGIRRNTVKVHCNAFVLAGIFIANGTTAHGSPSYRLNKVRFLAYMKGSVPLAPVNTRINIVVSELPPVNEGLGEGVNGGLGGTVNEGLLEPLKASSVSLLDTCGPEVPLPPVNGGLGGTVNGGLGGVSMADQGGSPPLTPKIKEKKEEESKDTHTRGRECVCVANSPEQNAPLISNSLANKACLAEARAYFTISPVNQVKPSNERSASVALKLPGTEDNPAKRSASGSLTPSNDNPPQRSASGALALATTLDPPQRSASGTLTPSNDNPAQRSASGSLALPPSQASQRSASTFPDVEETIADSQIQGSWSYYQIQRLSKRQLAIWHKLKEEDERQEHLRELSKQRAAKKLAALRYKEYLESCTETPRADELGALRWTKEGGLSAAERAEYFCEHLKTMRANGYFDETENKKRTFSLVVPEESLKTVYDFFELNPELEPDYLINALKTCCIVNVTEPEPEAGTYSEHFHQWKAGANLKFFFKYFSNVTDLAAIPPSSLCSNDVEKPTNNTDNQH